MPQRVDVWMVEMDLISREASNRQTEVLQPSGSFPQPASPRLWWSSLAGVPQVAALPLPLPLPIHSLEALFLLRQVLSSHSSLWPQVTCCNTTSPVQHPDIPRAREGYVQHIQCPPQHTHSDGRITPCSITQQVCSSLCWSESVSLKRSQTFKSAHKLKMPQ